MKKILTILLGIMLCPQAFAYNDVNSGNPNKTAIDALTEQGVISGYADGGFHPEANINRAEYTKMLVNAFQPDFNNYSVYKNCFPDVTNQWYAPYICYAKSQNWIQGYRDGNFHPEKNINLAEGVKIDLEVTGIDSTECVDTTGAGTWYAPYLCAAKSAGIITEEEYQNPASLMRRGETAQIMYQTQNQKKTQNQSGQDNNNQPTDNSNTDNSNTDNGNSDTNNSNNNNSNTDNTPDNTQTYQNKILTGTTLPSDDFLISNTAKVQLMQTSFSANLENVWGQKIAYTFTGDTNNFTNFYLSYPNSENTNYYIQTQAVGNTITFNPTEIGQRIFIPKNSESTITLYADIASSQNITVGQNIQFTFEQTAFSGLGQYSQSPYNSSNITISGDTTSKQFTTSKGALSIATDPASPESYRTPSVADTVAIFDIANASSKSSTISMLNISLSGSFIHSSANLINLKIYDNPSKSASNLVISASASPTDGQVDFGQITTFMKPIEIGSSNTKKLYFVLDTTDGNCTVPEGLCSATSGNATFQALLSDYSWSNDGVIFKASDIGGVSLPVEGNVLKY